MIIVFANDQKIAKCLSVNSFDENQCFWNIRYTATRNKTSEDYFSSGAANFLKENREREIPFGKEGLRRLIGS